MTDEGIIIKSKGIDGKNHTSTLEDRETTSDGKYWRTIRQSPLGREPTRLLGGLRFPPPPFTSIGFMEEGIVGHQVLRGTRDSPPHNHVVVGLQGSHACREPFAVLFHCILPSKAVSQLLGTTARLVRAPETAPLGEVRLAVPPHLLTVDVPVEAPLEQAEKRLLAGELCGLYNVALTDVSS